jgi:hypothetical protein
LTCIRRKTVQSLHTRSFSTQDIFNQFNELYRSSDKGVGSPLIADGMGGSDPTSPTNAHLPKTSSFPTYPEGGNTLSDR